jgi:peptidyl-prolyl cis-trans isomerase C
MKLSGLRLILCLVFIACLLTGCEKLSGLFAKKAADTAEEAVKPAPEVSGTLVARINNIPVTLEGLTKEIENYNALVPEDRPELKVTTREQKLEYLKNEVVRRCLMYQEALDRGLDRNPEIQQTLENTRQNLLAVELVKDEAGKISVVSSEIEDYYNQYKEELKEPEERRLREIVMLSEAEAKDVLIQLLQGQDFAGLARERSKAASSKNGGDLGFITPGKKFTQFDAVAFSNTLEVGQLSSIFKGPEGYYILKLEAKRGGEQRSLSDMWDDIKRGLTFLKQQQRLEELIGELSRKANIEIYEQNIK